METVTVIMCNAPDLQTARTIAHELVSKHLAACVNLLPGVQSVYRWEGQVEDVQEVTLVIKTIASRYGDVEHAIRSVHPYQLPEIISLPVVAGLRQYLDWVQEESRNELDV